MDYEKKYKEALGWMQSVYPTMTGVIKEDAEHYFPELKESEGEKIRKDLIQILQNALGVTQEWKSKVIAWLEKQGEKFQYWKPSKEQLKALDYAYNSCSDTERGNYYEGVLETLIDDLRKLSEKQGEQKPIIEMITPEESLGIDSDTYNKIVDECIYGEQKPADKVEPKFKVGQTIKKEGFNSGFPIVKIENGFYYNDMGDNFPFTDQDNWELVEQKPADWSEEDDKILKSIIINIENLQFSEDMREKYHHIPNANKSYYQIKIDWLKSIKERVVPQQKQEWNEEDEDIVKDTIYFLDTAKKHYASTIELDACIEWLKSLRPQKQWKPSDEQMKALDDVISSKDIKYDVLSELYKDLKKLREE